MTRTPDPGVAPAKLRDLGEDVVTTRTAVRAGALVAESALPQAISQALAGF